MDDYYTEIAPGYDELHGAEQDAKIRELLSRASLPVHATVLDVGCGTGRSLAFFPDACWQGIEPSSGLIANAHDGARPLMNCGIAEELQFGDASFDLVLCVTVLQNVRDPARALDEMRRVLKPGGTLLLSFLRKAEKRATYDALIRERFAVRDSWEFAQDACYAGKR